MSHTGLLHPEPLPLRESTADLCLSRRHSNTVCLSLFEASGSWCAQGLFEPSECLWWVWAIDLTDREPEELWADVPDTVQEAGIKTIAKKKECKRQNGCLRRLTNSCEKKSERQRRKEKIIPFECRVPKNSKERYERLL